MTFRVTRAATGHVVLTKGSTAKSCSGLKIAIDRTTFLTTFTVPRSCLGNPGYVKVGVGVFTTNSGDTQEWAEDGLRNGTVGNDLTLSPGIARG